MSTSEKLEPPVTTESDDEHSTQDRHQTSVPVAEGTAEADTGAGAEAGAGDTSEGDHTTKDRHQTGIPVGAAAGVGAAGTDDRHQTSEPDG